MECCQYPIGGYQYAKSAFNLIRFVEFAFSAACVGVAIYDVVNAIGTLAFSFIVILTVTATAYTVITFVDIIATSFLKPIFWNSWLLFAMSAVFFYFLCVGILLATGTATHNIILLGAILNTVAAISFLIDVIVILYILMKSRSSIYPYPIHPPPYYGQEASDSEDSDERDRMRPGEEDVPSKEFETFEQPTEAAEAGDAYKSPFGEEKPLETTGEMAKPGEVPMEEATEGAGRRPEDEKYAGTDRYGEDRYGRYYYDPYGQYRTDQYVQDQYGAEGGQYGYGEGYTPLDASGGYDPYAYGAYDSGYGAGGYYDSGYGAGAARAGDPYAAGGAYDYGYGARRRSDPYGGYGAAAAYGAGAYGRSYADDDPYNRRYSRRLSRIQDRRKSQTGDPIYWPDRAYGTTGPADRAPAPRPDRRQSRVSRVSIVPPPIGMTNYAGDRQSIVPSAYGDRQSILRAPGSAPGTPATRTPRVSISPSAPRRSIAQRSTTPPRQVPPGPPIGPGARGPPPPMMGRGGPMGRGAFAPRPGYPPPRAGVAYRPDGTPVCPPCGRPMRRASSVPPAPPTSYGGTFPMSKNAVPLPSPPPVEKSCAAVCASGKTISRGEQGSSQLLDPNTGCALTPEQTSKRQPGVFRIGGSFIDPKTGNPITGDVIGRGEITLLDIKTGNQLTPEQISAGEPGIYYPGGPLIDSRTGQVLSPDQLAKREPFLLDPVQGTPLTADQIAKGQLGVYYLGGRLIDPRTAQPVSTAEREAERTSSRTVAISTRMVPKGSKTQRPQSHPGSTEMFRESDRRSVRSADHRPAPHPPNCGCCECTGDDLDKVIEQAKHLEAIKECDYETEFGSSSKKKSWDEKRRDDSHSESSIHHASSAPTSDSGQCEPECRSRCSTDRRESRRSADSEKRKCDLPGQTDSSPHSSP